MSRNRLSRHTALGRATRGTRASNSNKFTRPSQFSRRASASTGALSAFGLATRLCGISSALTQTTTDSSRHSEPSPNHALHRTAPRVTVAAVLARTRLVRSWRCPTSVVSFCAPPSQLPRQPPPSLSLGSLGRFETLALSQLQSTKRTTTHETSADTSSGRRLRFLASGRARQRERN